eukprot:gene3332-4291_t
MSDQYTAYVGAENIEVGRTAGIYANTVLKGKGNVVEISELPGSSADIDRHKGFVESISSFPGIHLVAKLDGGEESIRTAINILEKQPFKRENRLQSTLIDSSNVRIMKLQNQK